MRRIICFSILIMVLMMMGCQKNEEDIQLTEIQEEAIRGDEQSEKEDSIYVHVCGQVLKPGVYQLAKGSRIFEALEAAGGMTEAAARDSLNQAMILEDGQQILVLSESEVQNAQESSDGIVNLNKASKEELMTLSGIGESKADAIIQYREEHGGFQSTEEIMEIEGIKEGVFQKIKDQIKVS